MNQFKIGEELEITVSDSHPFPVGTIVTVVRSVPNAELYDVCNYKLGDCWWVPAKCLKSTQMLQKTLKAQMKDAVLDTANKLLKANNTVTTLEIKNDLRKASPQFYWTQDVVSSYMNELAIEGKFKYTDNGTHRIYSSTSSKVYPTVHVQNPATTTTGALAHTGIGTKKNKTAVTPVTTPKKTKVTKAPVALTSPATRISRKKALELMKDNKGRFFTATFTKKDGVERTINCQYKKDQDELALGYVKVNESARLKNKTDNPIRQINLQTLKTLKIAGGFYKISK